MNLFPSPRHTALALAIAACATVSAHAQGTSTGRLEIRAAAGDSVTIARPDIGLERTATIGDDGRHRFAALPPGKWAITRNGGETRWITVEGDASVAVVYDETGASRVRTVSIEAATVLPVGLTDRLPVGRDATSVALLAPGTVRGDAAFGELASFGGASVAENRYYLNGLDITRAADNLGFAQVPFQAIEAHRIRTAGRGASAGNAFGGVVEQTTRRGSNSFHAGANLYYTPESLAAEARDTWFSNPLAPAMYGMLHSDNSRDEGWTARASAWASGALVKDRLFAYGVLARDRAESDAYGSVLSTINRHVDETQPAWLLKMDWSIAPGHSLEMTGFSSERTRRAGTFFNEPGVLERQAFLGREVLVSTDEGYVASYAGQATEALAVTALYGQVRFDRDAHVELASGARLGESRSEDTRRQLHLGAQWTLGDHRIGFGHDRRTDATDAGDLHQAAYYVEDHWQATTDLTAYAGARWDDFRNTDAVGQTYFHDRRRLSPSVGFDWDVGGDGRLQVFGSAGRDAMPPSPVAITAPYHAYAIAARNLEAMQQDEYVLGFRTRLAGHVDAGVRGIYRDLKRAIEDTCDYTALLDAPGSGFTFDPDFGWWRDSTGAAALVGSGFPFCRLFNPGQDAVFTTDYRGDGATTTVTVAGSRLAPAAERTYRALEFFLAGEWERLFLQGSYTYAHGKGNHEGGVSSDFGDARTNATIEFDYPELARDAHGYLPNDRRHNLKLFGSYDLTDELALGFNLLVQSGRPVSCLGVLDLDEGPGYRPHPYGAVFRQCGTTPAIGSDDATVAAKPRGSAGRLPWTGSLDLGLAWRPARLDGLAIRVDVFNLFDSQKVTAVTEVADNRANGAPSASYLLPRSHQAPRSVRLKVEYAF